MANRFWGVNRGQQATDVSEGAASPTKDVELNLNLAKSITRNELLDLLELIKIKILKDNWPPA